MDHALVAGLSHLAPAQQTEVVSLLLERGHDAGLNALPQVFDRLEPAAQAMMVASTSRLFGSLRANVRHSNSRVRLNVVKIIRQSGNLRLAYLAALAVHDSAHGIRAEAAATLRHLADRHCRDYEETVSVLRDAVEPDGELSPTVVRTLTLLREERRFLISALRDAVNKYESHHQVEVLEAAMFFAGELEDALFQHSAICRGKLTRAMLDVFSRAPSPRLASFAYVALCYPELRKRVLATLGICRDTRFFTEFIRHHWLARDPAVRKNLHLIRSMAWLGNGVDSAFLLPSAVAAVAPFWLLSLGLPSDRKVSALHGFLLLDNPAANRAAVWALVKINTPAGSAVLEGALEHDDPSLRKIVERELKRRRTGKVGSRPPVRGNRPQAWIELLHTAGVAEDFDELWRCFGSLRPEQSRGVGRWVLKYVPGCATQIRVKLLGDQFAERLLAMQFCVAFGLTGVFRSEIFSVSNDANSEIRAAAMTALGHIGDPTSRRILRRALQDEDAGVQACAIGALDHLTPRGCEEAITAKTNSSDAGVRAAAIRALLRLHVPEAAGALMNMLHDGRVEHRCTALWVVDQLKLFSLAPRIGEMANNDTDPRVSRIARHVAKRLNRQSRAGRAGLSENREASPT